MFQLFPIPRIVYFPVLYHYGLANFTQLIVLYLPCPVPQTSARPRVQATHKRPDAGVGSLARAYCDSNRNFLPEVSACGVR